MLRVLHEARSPVVAGGHFCGWYDRASHPDVIAADI